MPTGFTIGGITFLYYSALLLLGIGTGTGLAIWKARQRGRAPAFLLDALPWCVLGGILGARTYHVLFPTQSMIARGLTRSYYLSHFYDALALWKGGFDPLGAVLGGGAAFFLSAHLMGRPGLEWADIAVPGLALGQAVSAWGRFFNQELYGKPTDLPWATFIDPLHRLPGYEDVGLYHPLYLYLSLWSLFTMGAVLWADQQLGQRHTSGTIFLLYVFFFSVGHFSLTFLELDVSRVGALNLDQLLTGGAAVISSGFLIKRFFFSNEG
jgi:phosphatidylglycerol:prolipoprotein diacylglycerol transferase